MKKRIGIVRFWGTNCDYDIQKWVTYSGYQSEFLWFTDRFEIKNFEALIIPGGFSYGDYLRCGALAARSQVMESVREFANAGGPVLGICNGFQILCESGLLPGALVPNVSGQFIDDVVEVEVCQTRPNLFTQNMTLRARYHLPIAHGDGRYYAPKEELSRIESEGLVWLRYLKNPNGSLNDIAGVMNSKGNVFGLMPHPERAMQSWMGSTDGLHFLQMGI